MRWTEGRDKRSRRETKLGSTGKLPSSRLLAFSRTPRRRVDRIAGSARLFFRRPFDRLAGFAPVAMGHLFLVCRMLVIVGLEMFLLMLGTFAIFPQCLSNELLNHMNRL